ncbi:MAG TPA: PstS family phosphate ABC transporter substrate-binding protein, partial [Elusimicrobiota bacterium]|nr:PstS family phosphate ABC transporter substrate-binding protein [Elusimicrobiota bacterium]
YYELPIAFDALTVMVNPKNTWATTMTVAELKKIWEPAAQGQVTKWNQVNPTWPDKPLKLYGAGSDSGTFDYFTEAVNGKAKSSRGDYTASEDDNVLVQGIASDEGSLGYFGLAYYAENKDRLKAVAVNAGKGGVLPSEQTVMDGTYQPLARPIFIYPSKRSAKKPEVQAFVEFYLKNAPALVKEVKYVPLPNEEYAGVLARFQTGQTGTAFGGKAEIGVKIQDLLKRKPKI